MSRASSQHYRSYVFHNPQFVPYFQATTPVLELSDLKIGSRPAKRKKGGGVETLRAIPWVFAWTQVRFHLPVWLGLSQGAAVNEGAGQGGGQCGRWRGSGPSSSPPSTSSRWCW